MEKKITTEIEALAAVKKNGDMLEGIPEKLRTEKVCLAALKNDALLRGVPEALRTEQICRMALKQPYGYMNFEWVPKSIMTEEFCITAAEGYIRYNAYEFLPETIWKNEKFCRALLSHPGVNLEALEHIAKELWQKEDFCRFALGVVKDPNGNAQREIPKHIPKKLWQNEDFCRFALSEVQDRYGFAQREIPKHIPKEVWQKEDFCRFALGVKDTAGYVQKEVPNYISKKVWENKDFCRFALGVNETGYVLPYVPEDLITLKMCHTIIKKGGTAKYAPQKFKAELYKAQFEHDPEAIRGDIPPEELTPELCSLAVKSDASNLQWVPGKLKSMELCLSAAQDSKDAYWYRYMPEKLKFKVLAAVIEQGKFDPKDIQFLPNDMMDKAKELCAKAPAGKKVTAKKPAVKKPAAKKPAAKPKAMIPPRKKAAKPH